MNPWIQLRRFTSARVALGSAGVSLPTTALLEFQAAHAKARDAVHAPLNTERLERDLQAFGWKCLKVRSAARDRAEYLMRPDLGRTLLDEENSLPGLQDSAPELLFVLADGLSALAIERHAVALLKAVLPQLPDWRVGPIVIAEQARVAIGDEIGEQEGAEIVAVLIGERPGLSSPDSLGVYVTYRPHVGCSDAQRNCISNIRPGGLSYEAAAHRLAHLLESARTRRLTGVALKDESSELLELE